MYISIPNTRMQCIWQVCKDHALSVKEIEDHLIIEDFKRRHGGNKLSSLCISFHIIKLSLSLIPRMAVLGKCHISLPLSVSRVCIAV